MKDDRLRVPVEDNYVISIGRAAYVFANLEWNAVHCCDRIKAGYVRGLGKKTARQIADDLLKYAKRLDDLELRANCLASATEFSRLVGERNALLHAVPGTTAAGEQRLMRNGHPWTLEAIDDLADAFSECSMKLNELLHHRLP